MGGERGHDCVGNDVHLSSDGRCGWVKARLRVDNGSELLLCRTRANRRDVLDEDLPKLSENSAGLLTLHLAFERREEFVVVNVHGTLDHDASSQRGGCRRREPPTTVGATHLAAVISGAVAPHTTVV